MIETYKVSELIKAVRELLGDSTCSISEKHLIANLNTSLRRLAREKGLDKLFTFQETFELASINTDGTNSASWWLNCGGTQMFTDIMSLLILDSSGSQVYNVEPCWLNNVDFRSQFPLPEQCAPGTPGYFTLINIGGRTKIVFDRPIDGPYMVDMMYSAFHPRITSIDDDLLFPYAYADILEEMVKILYLQESSDFASSIALLEQYDWLVAQARELLARQPSGAPPRRMAGGW